MKFGKLSEYGETTNKEDTLIIYVKKKMQKEKPEEFWNRVSESIHTVLAGDNYQLQPIKVSIHRIDEKKYKQETIDKILKILIDEKKNENL